MAGRRREDLSGKSLKLPFRRIHQRLKRPGKNRTLIIHAAYLEHQGAGLHLPVFLPAFGEGDAAGCRNVAVAGSIDHTLGTDYTAPALILYDYALNRPLFDDRTADDGVKKHLDSGFFHHRIEKDLLHLVIDGVLTGISRDPPVKRTHGGGSIVNFLQDLAGGPSAPVGHHSCRGHSAQAVLHLDHQRPASQLRRTKRRPDPRRASSCNKDIHLCQHGQLLFRMRIKIHNHPP